MVTSFLKKVIVITGILLRVCCFEISQNWTWFEQQKYHSKLQIHYWNDRNPTQSILTVMGIYWRNPGLNHKPTGEAVSRECLKSHCICLFLSRIKGTNLVLEKWSSEAGSGHVSDQQEEAELGEFPCLPRLNILLVFPMTLLATFLSHPVSSFPQCRYQKVEFH